MEGIPGELIFVLIFIAFSVLEALGRKKKAERQGGAGPRPTPRRRSSAAEDEEGPGTDLTPAGVTEASASEPQSSEEMIPSDVWEEILGLARGKPPASKPEPVEEPVVESSWDQGRREEVLPEFEARSLEPLEARPDVIRALPDRTRTDKVPSISAKSLPDPVLASPVAKKSGPGSLARRSIFGGGTVKELQKAVILQEVLGPPVGMKK